MLAEVSNARVTLRDIARRLSVSHTAVSRALKDDPSISKTMRQRVQQTAREMGHRPDPMLSALAHYRRGKTRRPIGAELAWINHWPNPRDLRSFKEFNLYWEGARSEAEVCGFRLEEFVLNREISPLRLERIFRTRNISGILLPPGGGAKFDCQQFKWDDFCIVRFGYSTVFPQAHLVTSDQVADGVIAFENIWNNGYRRIGMVTSVKMHTRFSAGYLYGQIRFSPDLRLPPLILKQESHEDDRRCLQTWLKVSRPDAILTDLSILRNLLSEIGVKVPKDVGLAALSVLDGNADAGIDQNSRTIGGAAVQMLISLINHHERGVPDTCRELLIKGKWVNGSTLPFKK